MNTTAIVILVTLLILIGLTLLFLLIRKNRIACAELRAAYAKNEIYSFLSSYRGLFYSPKAIERINEISKLVDEVRRTCEDKDFLKKETEEIKKEAYKSIEQEQPFFDPSFGFTQALEKSSVNMQISLEKQFVKLELAIKLLDLIIYHNTEVFKLLYPFVRERKDFQALVQGYLQEEKNFYHLARRLRSNKLAKRSKESILIFLSCINMDNVKNNFNLEV